MGHIGLTPQSVHAMGGFKVQGRKAEAARRLVQAAKSLAHAGCYALVLEGVPVQVAEMITEAVEIPTIGIGAGPHCDGQVLVYHDLLGFEQRLAPKFVRRYADLHDRRRRRLCGASPTMCAPVPSRLWMSRITCPSERNWPRSGRRASERCRLTAEAERPVGVANKRWSPAIDQRIRPCGRLGMAHRAGWDGLGRRYPAARQRDQLLLFRSGPVRLDNKIPQPCPD